MAVTCLRWLIAASAWLPAARAGLEREQPGAWGAVQTPGLLNKEAGLQLAAPVITPRPAPRELRKRDTNTCGYVEGNSMSAYICANSQAQCLYNTVASAVGCCLTTSCNIYTACLDYVSSDATRTLDMDRTRYCSNSNSPSCAVLKYADPTGSLSGFTIPQCDTVRTTYEFYFSSFGANTRSTSSRSTLSLTRSESTAASTETSDGDSTTTETTSTRGSPATSTAGANDDGGGGGNQPPATQSSSTPVGPIVGGVVGGVAALGLLGLGIFFLIRRKKQNPPSPSAPGMPPPSVGPGPGYMPPPGHGAYPDQTPPPQMAGVPGTPGAFDPRYSMASTMAKPAMASSVSPMQGPPLSPMNISPANSPPPPGFHNHMQTMAAVPPHHQMGGTPPPHQSVGTPPPQQHPMGTPPPPGSGPYAPYPGPQYMHQQPQHNAIELPTQRGDGQVHELS